MIVVGECSGEGRGGGRGGKEPPHQKYHSTSVVVLWESDQVPCEL